MSRRITRVRTSAAVSPCPCTCPDGGPIRRAGQPDKRFVFRPLDSQPLLRRRSGTSRRLLALAVLLAACASERGEPQPVAAHPAVAADARCRDCHAAPEDAPGDAPPAPVWHVLDCCGPDFADCRPCHTTEAFRPALFDHAGWPLDGAHRVPDPDAPLRCDRCHAAALPADDAAPARCFDCHAADRPTVSHGFASDRCADCHTAAAFAPAATAHPDAFPLTGPHADHPCAACHLPGLERAPLRADCACCHTGEALGAAVAHDFPLRWRPLPPGADPAARVACAQTDTLEPGLDCDSCHAAGFAAATFAHDGWPLTGAHAGERRVGDRALPLCDACHLDRAEAIPTRCDGCHVAGGRASAAPGDHAPIDRDCAAAGCHAADASAW